MNPLLSLLSRRHTVPATQLNNYGVAHMECRVDSRGDTPLLCAKPRGEKAGHPAMFLSLGNVNIMQLQQVRARMSLFEKRKRRQYVCVCLCVRFLKVDLCRVVSCLFFSFWLRWSRGREGFVCFCLLMLFYVAARRLYLPPHAKSSNHQHQRR